MDMTETNWEEQLTPEQYHVLREKGTEPPFTGELLHNTDSGAYVCAACGNELFSSEHKFDSGSGWPSFYDVSLSDAVVLTRDETFGMERTEVTCKKCGGHLGHVFDDGPADKTGKRYCINSLSLNFKKQN